MTGIDVRHWALALGLALAAHLGLAYLLYDPTLEWRPEPIGGVTVALVPGSGASPAIAGAAPAETLAAVAAETHTTLPVEAIAEPLPAAEVVQASPPVPARAVERQERATAPSEPQRRPTQAKVPQAARKDAVRNGAGQAPPAPGPAPGSVAPPASGRPGGGSAVEAAAAPLPGNPEPHYPRIARRQGYQGRVVIRVSVRPDGTPGTAEIHRSSGHGILDQAALAAVRRWRFRPTARGGRPVEAVIDVPIMFRLERGP